MTEPSQGTGGAPAVGAVEGSTDLVGQVLAGRYRILEKLGEGAMGAVYLGEHVRMGRKDAIKVLRGPLAADPEAVRRFNRGARNVSAVHHPNVCTIYDFSDTAEGVTFLAMELIQGLSLKELLEKEGALAPERAVGLARQVADALQAAHDAGIVHRDLKPGNIMLTRDRRGAEVVKVVDFDIAKGQEEAEGSEVTRVGFVVGTPEYMSPEQLMGEKLDGRSDLYSLGLVLFRMLTGSLPFRADSPQELMVQRLTHTPLRLEEAAPGRTFPPGLQVAIDRALGRRPGDRQESAAEFGREIVAALAGPAAPAAPLTPAGVAPTIVAPLPAGAGLGGAPAQAPAPGTTAPTPGPAPRPGPRPLVLAGGLLVLVLALGGAVAWFVLGRGGSKDGGRVPGPSTTSATTTTATGPVTPPTGPVTPPTGPSAGPTTSPTTSAEGPGTMAATTTPAVSPPPAVIPAGRDGGGAGPPTASGREPRVTRTPTLSASRAEDILFRQLDRFGSGNPSGAEARAIRDTARSMWDMQELPAKQRALAAYVVGNSYIATGETSTAVTWLRRAVALDPGNRGYTKLLNSYAGQAP